ncbi:zinc ribbon domain-containing protein [bacterium]|nr:zinc ribbon domain-containing protein [bacterium]
MKCKNCNKEIPDDSKFCPLCGGKIEFEAIKKEEINNNIPNYLNISPSKLVFLSVITCGLYEFYWFYYNWCREKEKTDKKIMPFWRAVFSIFYVSELFKNVNKNAKNLGYNKNIQWKALSFIYIIFSLLGNISSTLINSDYIEEVLLGFLLIPLSYLALISIFRMQKVINYINNNNKNYQEKKVFIGEKILIISGMVLFIGGIYIVGSSLFFTEINDNLKNTSKTKEVIIHYDKENQILYPIFDLDEPFPLSCSWTIWSGHGGEFGITTTKAHILNSNSSELMQIQKVFTEYGPKYQIDLNCIDINGSNIIGVYTPKK